MKIESVERTSSRKIVRLSGIAGMSVSEVMSAAYSAAHETQNSVYGFSMVLWDADEWPTTVKANDWVSATITLETD